MLDSLWSSVLTFWHSEHFWDGITAVSTAAAAVFTAVMARFTFRAIREGQGQRRDTNEHFEETRKQGEKHHQDGFRPLLTLSPLYGMDLLQRGNLLTTTAQNGRGVFCINCALRNIGPGPALNVRLTIRASGQFGDVATRELSPLEAGGTGKQDVSIEVPVIFTDQFNTSDFGAAPGGLWTIVLNYEDVFGNAFHTLHSKNSMDPWCRVGKGPLPEFP